MGYSMLGSLLLMIVCHPVHGTGKQVTHYPTAVLNGSPFYIREKFQTKPLSLLRLDQDPDCFLGCLLKTLRANESPLEFVINEGILHATLDDLRLKAMVDPTSDIVELFSIDTPEWMTATRPFIKADVNARRRIRLSRSDVGGKFTHNLWRVGSMYALIPQIRDKNWIRKVQMYVDLVNHSSYS